MARVDTEIVSMVLYKTKVESALRFRDLEAHGFTPSLSSPRIRFLARPRSDR